MTTDTLTTTSELSAINTMISMVGKGPLNALTNLTDVEAIQAQAILTEVSRAVQASGLSFNSEDDMTLSRELNTNKITLPTNTAMFRPARQSSDATRNLVERGGFVYDVDDATFVFTADISADLILLLSFDTIPEYARQYIMIRAGRVFQDRFRVSPTRHQFSTQDEALAMVEFKKQEGRVKKYARNFKRGGGYVAETLYRGRYLGGY